MTGIEMSVVLVAMETIAIVSVLIVDAASKYTCGHMNWASFKFAIVVILSDMYYQNFGYKKAQAPKMIYFGYVYDYDPEVEALIEKVDRMR